MVTVHGWTYQMSDKLLFTVCLLFYVFLGYACVSVHDDNRLPGSEISNQTSCHFSKIKLTNLLQKIQTEYYTIHNPTFVSAFREFEIIINNSLPEDSQIKIIILASDMQNELNIKLFKTEGGSVYHHMMKTLELANAEWWALDRYIIVCDIPNAIDDIRETGCEAIKYIVSERAVLDPRH